MCKTRSPYYLQQWVRTFQAHRDCSLKDTFGEALRDESSDDKSAGTFDIPDKDADEYLVDITDGMDLEDSMAEAGQSTNAQHDRYTTGSQSPGVAVEDSTSCDNVAVTKSLYPRISSNIEPKPPWNP